MNASAVDVSKNGFVAYPKVFNENNFEHVSSDRHDSSPEELLEKALREGRAVTAVVTEKGKLAEMKADIAGNNNTEMNKKIVYSTGVTNAYGSFISDACRFAAGISPVGRLKSDPECSYVFDALKAVSCRDVSNFARQAMDRILSGPDGAAMNQFGAFARNVQERNSYTDGNGITHGFSDNKNINSFQLSAVEYVAAYTLTDQTYKDELSNRIGFTCTKMLANDFAYSKEPGKFVENVEGNIKKLLEAASDLDFKDQHALVGEYIKNLRLSENRNFCRSPEFAAKFGTPELVKNHVIKVAEYDVVDNFRKHDDALAKELFSAMAKGNFPGMSVSESGSVYAVPPSVFLCPVSGDRTVTPKAGMYITLLKDAMDRKIDNGESVGYGNLADLSKNLLAHDEKGNLLPGKFVSCHYAASRVNAIGQPGKALCNSEYVPLENVQSKVLRERLKNAYAAKAKENALYRKGMKVLGISSINASGSKTLEEYLGKLEAASVLHVPFTADRSTVQNMQKLAAVKVSEILRDQDKKGNEFCSSVKFSDFWNKVDTYSSAEVTRIKSEIKMGLNRPQNLSMQRYQQGGIDR